MESKKRLENALPLRGLTNVLLTAKLLTLYILTF